MNSNKIVAGESQCTSGTKPTRTSLRVSTRPWRALLSVGGALAEKLGITLTSIALDPGNALFHQWFQSNPVVNDSLVVDVGGGNGHIAKFIAEVR